MKNRPDGFLGPENIDQSGEIFGYIHELHEYLWRFIRAELPWANGRVEKYLDIAIESAEYKKKKAT